MGIAHNFAASENDRASVMDYPHPLIELNKGQVDISNAYATGIGAWDKYTIAYGYQDFASDVDEAGALLGLVNNAIDAGFCISQTPMRVFPKELRQMVTCGTMAPMLSLSSHG